MRRGLVPTKMAAKLQTLAKLLVFMLHIYRLTFLELLTAVPNNWSTTWIPNLGVSYRYKWVQGQLPCRIMSRSTRHVYTNQSSHFKFICSLFETWLRKFESPNTLWRHSTKLRAQMAASLWHVSKTGEEKPERPPVWFLWFVVPYKMFANVNDAIYNALASSSCSWSTRRNCKLEGWRTQCRYTYHGLLQSLWYSASSATP